MTDLTTGTVYSDIGTGAFTSEDGEELRPAGRSSSASTTSCAP